MVTANDRVEALAPYVAPLEGRRGLLRLDFNENTVGPSPAVLAAIRALGPEAYATYPEYAGLHEAFAASAGVAADQVTAFNGVDAALRACFDAFGEPGARFLTTSPTFGYYRPCAELAGMVVDAVPYEEDFSFPEAAFAERLPGARLAIVCNPNNPTGTLASAATLLALAARSPQTLFVVDELYQPFTGVSVLPASLETPNVVVLRSLSKSCGIAGLRLGFAVAAAPLLDRLRRVTGPYDINAFAVVAGKAALADMATTDAYVDEVRQAKAVTVTELARRGVRHFADGGNYLLVWPPGGSRDVTARLREAGVLVRDMSGKALIDGSFRLTVGTREQMARFFVAFDEVTGAAR